MAEQPAQEGTLTNKPTIQYIIIIHLKLLKLCKNMEKSLRYLIRKREPALARVSLGIHSPMCWKLTDATPEGWLSLSGAWRLTNGRHCKSVKSLTCLPRLRRTSSRDVGTTRFARTTFIRTGSPSLGHLTQRTTRSLPWHKLAHNLLFSLRNLATIKAQLRQLELPNNTQHLVFHL